MVRALAVESDSVAPDGVSTSTVFEGDVEGRIEDWLVCYLEDRDPVQHSASLGEMLDAGSFLKAKNQKRRRSAPSGRRDLQTRHWARIAAHRGRSVVVIRLLDQLLIRESVIEELADEINDLIRAGDRRIVLSFAQVERMSSQIVAVVTRIHHCCATAPGGMLKVCGLRPDVADVFRLIGLGGSLVVCPDEEAALTSPWPQRPGPRPLPVSILAALTGPHRRPEPEYEPGPPDHGGEGMPEHEDETGTNGTPSFVWLIAETDLADLPKGCVIPVSSNRFVIGSGSACDLRLPMPGPSRPHAAIERRGRFLRLVGLDSGEVTAVNGRVLDATTTPLRSGDRIRLGSVVLKLVVINGLGDFSQIDDLVISWLKIDDGSPDANGEAATDEYASDEYATVEDVPVEEDEGSCTETGLRFKVVQDVLVVTPKIAEVDDEATVDQLRQGLAELSALPLPGHVVLNFSHVGYINSRWLGALMAYLLRLERAGGSLRICELHSRVLTVLEQFRMTALIEVFATVEDAVLTAWD